MDTATRTRKIASLAMILASSVLLGAQAHPATGSPAAIDSPPVVVQGADVAQEQAVDWAIRRFRQAGLSGLPSLEVTFHNSHDGCRGYLGYSVDGRIDLCLDGAGEDYVRKFALHEIAHSWVEYNLDAEARERFVGLRGLSGWNDPGVPWKERGNEQSAEVIAWGLGEGQIAPLLPHSPVPAAELVAAYVALTGPQPITPAAAA